MAQSVQFYSTNHSAAPVNFGEALLQGLAPDKGLYMPEHIPTFAEEEIREFSTKTYAEIAYAVFSKFFAGDIPAETLKVLCEDAYNFDIPLEQVYGKKYIMRLDQGPTASFKDFAGRAMGRLMQYFLNQKGEHKLILTATSGDTGSAVAHAFYDLPTIRVAILFPKDEVTPRQRKQMTTLQKNIHVLAIDGKFDDAQAMVKEAFSDKDLAYLQLTSANSINIGRLIPQAVYYFYAYSRLAKFPENITFCIPSGNFGDMMGCVIAREMGLPVGKILIASNANNEFERMLKTQKYSKIEPSIDCLSSAMNVGHPSNLARLVELYGGNMDEKGNLLKQPDFAAMNRDFFAISVSDEETKETIKTAWNKYNVMLEPHGAVGWKCVEDYISTLQSFENELIVSLETAHPAKFPDAIRENIGIDPELPASLQGIEEKPEKYDNIAGNYTAFKAYLLKNL
ncbi:MAG: threonine synthase [Bacteroidales bacterium]|jgi:threonine synthase|nr:threonine synthase [Bacteroidales bacterium]